MVTFKKYVGVVSEQVPAILGTNLYVGDIVKYLASTKAMTKISANVDANETLAEISTALSNGYKIYIVAQGDMITNNDKTAYKEYKIGDVVAASVNSAVKTVVAYPVKRVTDIELGNDLVVEGYAVNFANGDHYTITAKKNGSTITSGTKVDDNDTIAFTITPGDGYYITDIAVNSTSVISNATINTTTHVGTYSLTGVSATTTVTVTVAAITLSSIAVTTNPTKMTYTAGETFDPTGMVVTGTYSDTNTAVVTGYTTSPTTELTVADTTITVTYEGKTTTLTITVSAE